MTVNSEGSRSNVSSSMPRAMRAISMPVADALAPQAVGVDRLVRQREHVEQRVEMADRGVDVDRLDGIAAPDMDRIEALAEPQEILVVAPIAGPPAAVAVEGIGRAGDRAESDVCGRR